MMFKAVALVRGEGGLWLGYTNKRGEMPADLVLTADAKIVAVEVDPGANHGRGRSRVVIEFENDWEAPSFALQLCDDLKSIRKNANLRRPGEELWGTGEGGLEEDGSEKTMPSPTPQAPNPTGYDPPGFGAK